MGFRNQTEPPNMSEGRFENNHKKKLKNPETRNLGKPVFCSKSCETLYTCPSAPFYKETKVLLHSEIILGSYRIFQVATGMLVSFTM